MYDWLFKPLSLWVVIEVHVEPLSKLYAKFQLPKQVLLVQLIDVCAQPTKVWPPLGEVKVTAGAIVNGADTSLTVKSPKLYRRIKPCVVAT